ncbi:MAG: hypothetical protein JZD40_03795 [Sulfolobus sp.]|nr:hypothetical protein [Sulfolobus sp.]
MVEWIFNVHVNRDRYSEYKKLVEELKKIPDTALMIRHEGAEGVIKLFVPFGDSYKLVEYRVPNTSLALIYTFSDNYKYTEEFFVHYENGQVVLTIKDKRTNPNRVVEERKDFVADDKDATLLMVKFTRYALAKITKDEKYIKKSDIGADDMSKIIIARVGVGVVREEDLGSYSEFIDFLETVKSCKVTQVYGFEMIYAYPHTARDVAGDIFCCSDRCYLRITWESQEGDFHGNKLFVIKLNGREPTNETLREVLMTKKDMLIDIENYIIETLRD